MFLRILKRDFKRKKTMNAILILFIILASMFMASGLNNVITVINGTDHYMEVAGIGDYNIITMGVDSVGSLDGIIENDKSIKECRLEEAVFASCDNIHKEDGSKLETTNTALIQSINDTQLSFFDGDNKKVTKVEKGHALTSSDFMKKNGLEIGDKIILEHADVKMELILDGKVKDALLGSAFMGNTRFLINQEDYEILSSDETINKYYRGEVCYIDTDDITSLKEALTEVTNIAFDGDDSLIEKCYVMDVIIAFITLILSICLIIVSFVVLKFCINFTISEEFREIGVMKAIGIKNFSIRNLYIVKYMVMAMVGSVIGFIISIPFGNMLIKSVSENMVLSNEGDYRANVIGAVLVIITSIAFAYFCTRKVKKSSPLDAIRSGQTGERYKRKGFLRLSKSKSNTSFFLALNDVLSSPKRFVTVILTFFLCTTFVLVLVNTTATMRSKNLLHTFGKESDIYVTDTTNVMKYMNTDTKDGMRDFIDGLAKQLTDEGMPATACIELQYKYKTTVNGKKFKLSFQQGLNTKTTDYRYLEGYAPSAPDEVAITKSISRLTGAHIGDTITIHFPDGDRDCMVTAYFDTMNLMGEVIRLHEDAQTDMSHVASAMSIQFNFTDSPDENEIKDRKERIINLFRNDLVFTGEEYCVDCIGVVDTLESVQYLLLLITSIVVILVTILMEKTFITGEKTQIAILKAIGFKNRDVIKWHMYRFGIVGIISSVLAAACSIPITKLCITPVFGMMGATDLKYNFDPLKILLIYPGIVCLITLFAAFISALQSNKITSSDTANIE